MRLRPFHTKKISISYEAQMALVFFFAALLVRVLFLFATPDFSGPSSPYYKGDTYIWLEYAAAIQSSNEYNHGLPLRPPGVAYLVALLWNGQASGFLGQKLIWATMGAASVAFFYLAIARSFDWITATIAALLMSAYTGLIIVSTAPNNETPYFLLISLSLYLCRSLLSQPTWRVLLYWSILNGIACLIRVEHLLFFAFSSVWLFWLWAHPLGKPINWRRAAQMTVFAGTLFVLTLVPWHLYAWSQIDKFNRSPLALNHQTEQAYTQLENNLSVMRWTPHATAQSKALPMFTQRTLTNFVAATVANRGRLTVTGDDFKIIEEAFGYDPQPLRPYPFIALYGGLNFYLANNSSTTGGFSLDALDDPPPLLGGRNQYPGMLINGLPPLDLTFNYPPHLQAINQGYLLGWQWISNHPLDATALLTNKLDLFWNGVTMGFTGYGFPVGVSGIRNSVDIVVPEPRLGLRIWQTVGFTILLAGLWVGRKNKNLYPWLMLLATKLATTVLFYGYAREGVVVFPIFALLLALLITRLLSLHSTNSNFLIDGGRHVCRVATLVLLASMIAVESFRFISAPTIQLDGYKVGAPEPFQLSESEPHRLSVN